MNRMFPESIRKVGLFPLSLGNQGEHFYQTALKRLDAFGVKYEISLPKSGEYRYLAGTDQERAEALNRLLEDDSIDLLFSIRGGFGSVRTLPYINWDLMLQRNLPVVGFSDMTGFLLPAWKKGCTNCILGKMAEATFGNEKLSASEVNCCAESLCRCVAGETVVPPTPQKLVIYREGEVTAPVVPANLMVLISLIGTPWMPDLKNKILVIEAIGQNCYQIERNLTQLEQCGILGSLAGLVFGTFTGGDSPYQTAMFMDYAKCVKGPVCGGLKFGHEEPATVIRVGGTATLQAKAGEIPIFAKF